MWAFPRQGVAFRILFRPRQTDWLLSEFLRNPSLQTGYCLVNELRYYLKITQLREINSDAQPLLCYSSCDSNNHLAEVGTINTFCIIAGNLKEQNPTLSIAESCAAYRRFRANQVLIRAVYYDRRCKKVSFIKLPISLIIFCPILQFLPASAGKAGKHVTCGQLG